MEDEGVMKRVLPRSSLIVFDIPPSPGEVFFLMIVSSTSTFHGFLCQDSFLKNQIKKPVVDI